MKHLIVTLIVLVKLSVTSKINETNNCHRQQLIVSTVKQLLFFILLIYLLCRCNILLFIVTLIVLLYLIPISFTSFSSYRIDVSGALPHCYCHLHSYCHRHHHHRPRCQLSFLHQQYLLHHHHHHHPCLLLLPPFYP